MASPLTCLVPCERCGRPYDALAPAPRELATRCPACREEALRRVALYVGAALSALGVATADGGIA